MVYINVNIQKDYIKNLKIENNTLQPSKEIYDTIYNDVLNIVHGYSLRNNSIFDREYFIIKDLTQQEIDAIRKLPEIEQWKQNIIESKSVEYLAWLSSHPEPIMPVEPPKPGFEPAIPGLEPPLPGPEPEISELGHEDESEIEFQERLDIWEAANNLYNNWLDIKTAYDIWFDLKTTHNDWEITLYPNWVTNHGNWKILSDTENDRIESSGLWISQYGKDPPKQTEEIPLNFLSMRKVIALNVAEFSDGITRSYTFPNDGLISTVPLLNDYTQDIPSQYVYKINDSKPYFKFVSNLTIAKEQGEFFKNDPHKMSTMVNMAKRGKLGYPILQIYFNGRKIPDEETYGFMFEDKTDLFIPRKYVYNSEPNQDNSQLLKPGDNAVYVERRSFYQFAYLNRYFRNVNNKTIAFELAKKELKNRLGQRFSKDLMLVFCNGEFVHPDNYREFSVTEDSGKYYASVKIDNNPNYAEKCNIELFFDSSIGYARTNAEQNPVAEHLLWIDGEPGKFKPANGIVPKECCMFFLDGLRVASGCVRQTGRLSYAARKAIGNEPAESSKATMLLTDKGVYGNPDRHIYGEDYFLTNMVGVPAAAYLSEGIEAAMPQSGPLNISKYILGSGKIDFPNILTNGGILYDYEILKMQNIYFKEHFHEFTERSKALISLPCNFTLLRNLLNFFGRQEMYDSFAIPKGSLLHVALGEWESLNPEPDPNSESPEHPYNELDHLEWKEDRDAFIAQWELDNPGPQAEYRDYAFDEKTDESDLYKYVYIAEVNGLIVKPSQMKVAKRGSKDIIGLRIELFNEGVNLVHIAKHKEHRESGIEYAIASKGSPIGFIDAGSAALIDGNSVSFDTLGSVLGPEDYLCLVPNPDGPVEPCPEIESGIDCWADYEALYGELSIAIDWEAGKTTVVFPADFAGDFAIIQSKRINLKQGKLLSGLPEEGEIGVSIALFANDGALNLPLISNGTVKAYKNGEMLVPGREYELESPLGNPNIGYSKLTLKVPAYSNDAIAVHFTEMKSRVIMNRYSYVENKWGLLYFKGLGFPYSPRYVNLYINDRYIYPHEIELLSEKLIRVPSASNVMFNIFAETSFGADERYFRHFTESYQDSDFESQIAEWFDSFSFEGGDKEIREDDIGNLVFESFDEDATDFPFPNLNDSVGIATDRNDFIVTDEGKIILV